jgi:hypothetical protein
MSFQLTLLNGGLNILASLYPKAAPFISTLQKYEPMIEQAAPVIKAAIAEGGSAFDAAKAAAPNLAKSLTDLVSSVGAAFTKGNGDIHLENFTRGLVGIHKMTPEEEKAWMDRASPVSEDSRSGSG